jgi:hypothetical protein
MGAVAMNARHWFEQRLSEMEDEALRWSKHTGDGHDCTWGVIAESPDGRRGWRQDGSRSEDLLWRGTEADARDYAGYLRRLHLGSGGTYWACSFRDPPTSEKTHPPILSDVVGDLDDGERLGMEGVEGVSSSREAIDPVSGTVRFWRDILEDVLEDIRVWWCGA